MGVFFRKVMWVGRATTFCVGLAVVVAVVLCAASAALAAVPGDPFKLGRINAVDRITTLVGSASGAMLMVDNDGSGTALDLRVGNPMSDPSIKVVPALRVDSQAKVSNLNSDELDGFTSHDFVRHFSSLRTVSSAEDSSNTKTVTATCPDGETALSGYAGVGTQRISHDPIEVPVALQETGLSSGGWKAEARETEPHDSTWNLHVTAYCVPAPPEIVPAGE